MDRVRLGRALGYGTRHAAKTLAAVAEAATAPGPALSSQRSDSRAGQTREPAPPPSQSQPPARGPLRPPLRPPTLTQARQAGRSFWKPLATFSGALWLRVTGLFFGLIAFAMGNGAWRIRATVRADPGNAGHFWMFAGFALLFTYFAISGFVRANARERRG